MRQFRGVVPVGSDGYPAPDLADPRVEVHPGDICLTQSSERTAYTEWIRAGADWVQVGETHEPESEVDMLKRERVNKVRSYFRQKEDQHNKRKRPEAATESVSFFEEYPAVQQLWEDMK